MSGCDVLIAGGGLAGSLAAAMLGRAGARATLVDPHTCYPQDFRCEKLDGSQVAILRKTGLADAILRVATADGEAWVARFGHLMEKRTGDQHGIRYENMVNAVRAQVPPITEIIERKVASVSTSANRQTVVLSDGREISTRLVILANGLNIGLRHALGIQRTIVSPCHSITLGFDFRPVDRATFDFSSLTYYAERTSDRVAYLTLFPLGAVMRANLMVYRPFDDPWLQGFRRDPNGSLSAIMPRLVRLTGAFAIDGPIRIRPADLYLSTGHLQPGVVLVGDAFGTSCPAAGTGVGKVFTDVERLCNVHVPRWLASDGMGVEKIAAFYDDPEKQAYDTHSLTKAFELRSLSIDDAFIWGARRWARFLARTTVGTTRSVRRGLTGRKVAASIDTDRPAAADTTRSVL